MIYSYENKYYVNISPRIYCEVEVQLKNDELRIQPTHNKIELSPNAEISKIDLTTLKTQLKSNNKNDKHSVENKVKNSSKKYYY